MSKRIFICTPVTDDSRERMRRIDELSVRIRKRGDVPVYCDCESSVGDYAQAVATCDAMVLDKGYRKCRVCMDEYSLAMNRRLVLYHTKEEWASVKKNFII